MDNIYDFSWDQAYLDDLTFQTTYKKVAAGGEIEGFKIKENGILISNTFGEERICIPAKLMRKVLHVAYDALGHMGYKKTYDKIGRAHV